jgi:hypothetical protein
MIWLTIWIPLFLVLLASGGGSLEGILSPLSLITLFINAFMLAFVGYVAVAFFSRVTVDCQTRPPKESKLFFLPWCSPPSTRFRISNF